MTRRPTLCRFEAEASVPAGMTRAEVTARIQDLIARDLDVVLARGWEVAGPPTVLIQPDLYRDDVERVRLLLPLKKAAA